MLPYRHNYCRGRGKARAVFTLIEVVVALAILSLGVVSYLTLAN